MAPRRRRTNPPAPALAPMEDDDLLSEILLRLPPQPSSLPRASLVCKRWRTLLTHPDFLHRFRKHHRVRGPPIVGHFSSFNEDSIRFIPTLHPPDCIPADRFSLRLECSPRGFWRVMSFRHGRVLAYNFGLRQVVAWDPVTRHQLSLAVPQGLHDYGITLGSVFCAATEQDHVHAVDCHSSHFKVVLGGVDMLLSRLHLSVYSTATTDWTDAIAISLHVPRIDCLYDSTTNILIDGSLYWLLHQLDRSPDWVAYIIEFDVARQTMALIDVPGEARNCDDMSLFVPRETQGGGLGLFTVSKFRGQIWNRKADRDGVVRWVRGRTIQLSKELTHGMEMNLIHLYGYSELHNVMVVKTFCGDDTFLFQIQLESLQSMEISEQDCQDLPQPFTCFYPPGI